MSELNPRALITSVVIGVFKPRFHQGQPLYPPKQVQFEIGDTESGPYHYRSPIYDVNLAKDQEQVFSLEGDLTAGAYLRVNLIGKPKIQSMDGKHYIALRYVGVTGQVIGSQA